MIEGPLSAICPGSALQLHPRVTVILDETSAAGLRYVLYLFMTDPVDLTKIIHKPTGYFLAPEGVERVGDVSNVAFSNGWIADEDGRVFIYYASSDTRMHVATSTIAQLLDYVVNTPEDGLRSATSVQAIDTLIDRNEAFWRGNSAAIPAAAPGIFVAAS